MKTQIVKSSDEPIVVLLHYFGGDKGSWQWVTKQFSKSVSYIALNIAGFGEKPALSEINIHTIAASIYSEIVLMGSCNITIVGHSMSGKLALLVGAIDCGELIKNIILVAPSPPTIEKMTENERETMLDQQNLQRAKENVKTGIFYKIEAQKFDYAVASQLRVDSATWQWWINEGMRTPILQEVNQLKQNLHLIYSEEDKAIPVGDMQSEVIENLTFKSIYKIENVRHLIPLEKPKELADSIQKILLQCYC